MTKYRTHLPQLDGRLFLTDGGIETTLIFHDGFDLPHFAAFDLLREARGRAALHQYYSRYAAIAHREGVGFILESPTWRASADWGQKLGYTDAALAEANSDSIALMRELREEFETHRSPMVVSGCVGPRGDGYVPGALMTPAQAQAYHAAQIGAFAAAGADMVSAITMNYVEEAIGIARAADAAGLPVVISFTVETDGRLPSGQTLPAAIAQVDAATDRAPVYYMINCAHPTHFAGVLTGARGWTERIGGLRVNASAKSHAELDEATELDEGDPAALRREHGALLVHLPNVTVLGGCCGTDARHVAEASAAWAA